MEIIEPHPLLARYWEICRGMFCDFDGGKREFLERGEWHYIPSQAEQNIDIFKRMKKAGILPSDGAKICDCGFGLGEALFDLWIQSKEMGMSYSFSGIERHQPYIDYFREKLEPMWSGSISLIEGDIMSQDLSGYDMIYSYCPFKDMGRLIEYYSKIARETKPGTILLEYREDGFGTSRILDGFAGFMQVDIDWMTAFVRE
jgi:hypothetical protein